MSLTHRASEFGRLDPTFEIVFVVEDRVRVHHDQSFEHFVLTAGLLGTPGDRGDHSDSLEHARIRVGVNEVRRAGWVVEVLGIFRDPVVSKKDGGSAGLDPVPGIGDVAVLFNNRPNFLRATLVDIE